MQGELIEPEDVVDEDERYAPRTWDYPRKCADVDLALEAAREKIAEWDRASDPHGWWHDRSMLIALHNEVVRLRRAVGRTAQQETT